MPIDEKEPDSSIDVSRGGQASEQQRTFATDDERNAATFDHPGYAGADRGDHRFEVGWRDDPGGRVSLGTRRAKRDISVIVDVGYTPERFDQSGTAQGGRSPRFTSGKSGRIVWDTNQTNSHRLLIASQVRQLAGIEALLRTSPG